MNHEIKHFQALLVSLNRLLEKSGKDELLKYNLKSRIEQTEAELGKLTDVPGSVFPREVQEAPRGAIFFDGGEVCDGGIPASFVGNAILNYANIYKVQALHEERIEAKKSGRHRRVRGSPKPSLLLTGTPKGSFGIEFCPANYIDTDPLVPPATFEHIASAIARITSDGDLEEAIRDTPKAILNPLKKFLRLVATARVDMRLAFSHRDPVTFNADDVQKAADKLDARVEFEEVVVVGTPLGITLESGHFDFETERGLLLSGFVSDELDDDELAEIHNKFRIPSKATIETTVVKNLDGGTRRTHILMKVVKLTEQAEQE